MKNKFTISALITTASILSFAVLANAQETAQDPNLQVPQVMAPQGQNDGQGDINNIPNQQGGQPQKQPRILSGQQGNTPQQNGDRKPAPIQEQVINIDAKGKVLVRGALVSVSGTSLVVNSWGMIFNVDASKVTNTTAPDMIISSFTVGDFIGVSGTVTADNPQSIIAEVVRDRSIVPTKPVMNTRVGSSTLDRMDNGGQNQPGSKPLVKGKNPAPQKGVNNASSTEKKPTNPPMLQGKRPVGQQGNNNGPINNNQRPIPQVGQIPTQGQ